MSDQIGADWPDLQEQALEVWGPEAQMQALVEECGELVAAIAGDASLEEVYEEMVGVESVMRSLVPWVRGEVGVQVVQVVRLEQRRRLEEALQEATE